jgi:heme a synthase
MFGDVPLVDLTPLLRLMLLGIAIALGPLVWVGLRHRGASPVQRLRVLTAITVFITFDLVVFGAFTRLSDSGLGCPDWPGCYGEVTPLAAKQEIQAAQDALPDGPVTHKKAWIEMIHRYLATAVGVLTIVMSVVAWRERKSLNISPWWATAALVWCCVQGAFGALTVTMRLFPAIVTLHLLGGLTLLGLLAWQSRWYARTNLGLLAGQSRIIKPLAIALGVLVVQVALGGWVSTNYAVLACREFPMCQGAWWPDMNWLQGFEIWRPLGMQGSGEPLTFAALTAIHMAHRLFALVACAALLWAAWRVWQVANEQGEDAAYWQRAAVWLVALTGLQVLSGLSNVVLGWPLVAALGHSAGAAGLVWVLVAALAHAWPLGARAAQPAVQLAGARA